MREASNKPGGTVALSALALGVTAVEALEAAGVPIVGIVSVDDRYRSKSGMDPAYFGDFGTWCGRRTIDYLEVSNLADADVEQWVAAREPDWILSIGWPLMVPRSLRDVARKGTLGTHASLLPSRRGAAPLNWALIDGLSATGVSILELTDEVDAGPLVWQASFEIAEDDDVTDLLRAVEGQLKRGLSEIAAGLISGSVKSRPQDERLATWTRRRRPTDGRISWSQTSQQIHNLVRGLTAPFPGAWTELDGHPVRILRTRLVTGVRPRRAEPGTLLSVQRELLVVTGDYLLQLVTVDAAGTPEPANQWAARTGAPQGTEARFS